MPAKKKTASKKTATKKSATKKSATKKSATKKSATKKSTAKKKVARKKAPAKKVAAKKTKKATPTTTIMARVDVGFGNELYLRGEGGGLSWDQGVLMECKEADEWTWNTDQATTGIVFKFLINDELWSLGEDLTVPAGGASVTTPRF